MSATQIFLIIIGYFVVGWAVTAMAACIHMLPEAGDPDAEIVTGLFWLLWPAVLVVTVLFLIGKSILVTTSIVGRMARGKNLEDEQ